ncbi:MAG TPA: alpha/beta hydrolase [Polyangiaceae bacterium]|nr:alpha/beta hydrolase [Polyangiaceae bacterium]
MSAIFVSDSAKSKALAWFETFRAALPVATTGHYVDTPQGRTHVLVAGPENAPPLVCLHGALASSAHVLPELGSLVEHYRVYAVDVVGQSVMSEDVRLALDDDSYGSWLQAVCTGLGLSRITLLGVSWGGFVAMRAARVAPELIGALVLLVPAGVVAGSAWQGFTKVAWPMLRYRLSPSESSLQRVCDALFTTPDARWTQYFGDALFSYRFDMRVPPLARPEDVASYRGKTLIFGADQDLSFPGAALLARAKVLFPEAELELLRTCKHCPPFTNSFREQLAQRIRTFLGTREREAQPD